MREGGELTERRSRLVGIFNGGSMKSGVRGRPGNFLQ